MKTKFKILSIATLLFANLFILSCTNVDNVAHSEKQTTSNQQFSGKGVSTVTQMAATPGGNSYKLIFENNSPVPFRVYTIIGAKKRLLSLGGGQFIVDNKPYTHFYVAPGEIVTLNNVD